MNAILTSANAIFTSAVRHTTNLYQMINLDPSAVGNIFNNFTDYTLPLLSNIPSVGSAFRNLQNGFKQFQPAATAANEVLGVIKPHLQLNHTAYEVNCSIKVEDTKEAKNLNAIYKSFKCVLKVGAIMGCISYVANFLQKNNVIDVDSLVKPFFDNRLVSFIDKVGVGGLVRGLTGGSLSSIAYRIGGLALIFETIKSAYIVCYGDRDNLASARSEHSQSPKSTLAQNKKQAMWNVVSSLSQLALMFAKYKNARNMLVNIIGTCACVSQAFQALGTAETRLGFCAPNLDLKFIASESRHASGAAGPTPDHRPGNSSASAT